VETNVCQLNKLLGIIVKVVALIKYKNAGDAGPLG
jgi:hypothetical protein